jgi:tRNA 2-thiouridine synthesizing protein A
MAEPIAFDLEVDAAGLNCPLPILKAKKALASLSSGQVLKVIATDPGALRDFEAFAKQTGNALLAHESEGAARSFFLKRR